MKISKEIHFVMEHYLIRFLQRVVADLITNDIEMKVAVQAKDNETLIYHIVDINEDMYDVYSKTINAEVKETIKNLLHAPSQVATGLFMSASAKDERETRNPLRVRNKKYIKGGMCKRTALSAVCTNK